MDLKILKIASYDNNHNRKINFTHSFESKNSICGDKIKVNLKVKDDIIQDMSYECKSCVYTQASASLIAKNIKNKNILDLKQLCLDFNSFFEKNRKIKNKNLDFMNIFIDKKYSARKECIVLPIKALSNAFEEFKNE